VGECFLLDSDFAERKRDREEEEEEEEEEEGGNQAFLTCQRDEGYRDDGRIKHIPERVQKGPKPVRSHVPCELCGRSG
jgi:hypothetical protein